MQHFSEGLDVWPKAHGSKNSVAIEIQTDDVIMMDTLLQTKKSSFDLDFCTNNGLVATVEVQTAKYDEVIKDMIKHKKSTKQVAKFSLDVEETEEELKSLLHFLQTISPLIDKELEYTSSSRIFDDYSVNWEEEINYVSCAFTFELPKRITTDLIKQGKQNLVCTDISWNCTGSIIAASYGRFDQKGWCLECGYIAAWTIQELEDELETLLELNNRLIVVLESEESYVMCLDFHPKISNVVACGTYDGTIKVYKVAKDSVSPVAQSNIKQYTHRDPICGIKWLKNRFDDSTMICSQSPDGKILLWSLRNKLAQPVAVYNMNYPQKDVPLGGTCFSFVNIHAGSSVYTRVIPSTDDYFVVGTEVGGIFKSVLSTAKIINTNKKSTFEEETKPKHSDVEFTYESSIGSVNGIHCSPFKSNAFATASTDGLVRLFNLYGATDVLCLEPYGGALQDVQWSPFRPLVLATVGTNGHLYLFDLFQENYVTPVIDIEVCSNKPVYSVKFNPAMKEYIATGDHTGKVKVYVLNDALTIRDVNSKENSQMNQIFKT